MTILSDTDREPTNKNKLISATWFLAYGAVIYESVELGIHYGDYNQRMVSRTYRLNDITQSFKNAEKENSKLSTVTGTFDSIAQKNIGHFNGQAVDTNTVYYIFNDDAKLLEALQTDDLLDTKTYSTAIKLASNDYANYIAARNSAISFSAYVDITLSVVLGTFALIKAARSLYHVFKPIPYNHGDLDRDFD